MSDLISRSALELEPDEHNVMNGVRFVGGHRDGGRTIAMVKHILKKMIENAPAVDAVEVVRCRECSKRGDPNDCPMCSMELYYYEDGDDYVVHDCTTDEGFCHKGAKMDGGAEDG